ncbi:Alginate biosynthesis protein AlgA [Thalassocella blandensis]|nr:Alginate biosynthesis protein AlgA [Thalassocella blandensis]
MSNTTSRVIPVILSGGSGSRLWPKSRKAYPKQLHSLYGDRTMLQHTCERVSHLDAPVVVCNEEQRFLVADQLLEAGIQNPTILLEPISRNTAPAIAVAALKVLKENSDAILVVLPADHKIGNEATFQQALDIAIAQATQNHIVTFGIKPTKPETGFGYIKAINAGENGAAIEKFVEKPNLTTAEQYLQSDEYFWNSGMFVFSAQSFIDQLKLYEPEIIDNCEKSLNQALNDLDFVRLEKNNFSHNKSISIDYALMERTEKAWCVPLDCDWNDLGSWRSFWESSDKDAQGNAIFGDVLQQNCENSLVCADEKLIAVLGLENIAVIDTDDALLVLNLEQSEGVKTVVEQLESSNREEYSQHRKVYRPWGSYDSVDIGDRFKVKRLTVKPGASLSLQMHHHRAEHWIVVSGTALVQKEDEELMLTENQSVYIPLGQKHRLSNPGKLPLQLIEVQSGAYLGEDDIVRYEDDFRRTVVKEIKQRKLV